MEKLIIFVVIILAAKAQKYEDKVIKVNMDDSANCGKTQHVVLDQQLNLQSNGKSQNVPCTVPVHAHGKNTCAAYRQLCLKVEQSKMVDCNAKVTFRERLLDGRVGEKKELHCKSLLTGMWCTLSELIEVKLNETNFDSSNMKRDYAFNVTVSSSCALEDDYKQVNQDDADNMNRLIGIVTGLACCSIFLVTLLISFCCFRSKGWRHQVPK